MQENKEYKEININEINENEKRKSCGKQCKGHKCTVPPCGSSDNPGECFAPCILEEDHGGAHYCKHCHTFF
jgi:hypothetical protein